MNPSSALAIYCVACIVCALLGGWVPLVVRLTHRRMQIAVSFVSGVVLGIGLLHLVPHSFDLLRSIDATVMWVMAGFLFMFFLERFFHFHQHDAPEEPMSLVHAHSVEHGHDEAQPADTGGHDGHAGHEAHDHAHAGGAMASEVSWSSAAIGLTLHALIDGVAIAAAVRADAPHAAVVLAGFGTALAVIVHKPFDSLTIGTLMAAAGQSRATRRLLNVLYSLVTPLGIVVSYSIAGLMADESLVLGRVLGFAAGAFICIASSDLLPELQFHGHDRPQLSLALVAGIAIAWATVLLEGGHDHHAGDDTDHVHEHETGHDGSADTEHGHLHEEGEHAHEHEAHDHQSNGRAESEGEPGDTDDADQGRQPGDASSDTR